MTPLVHNLARFILRGHIQPKLMPAAWEILSATFFDVTALTDAIFKSAETNPTEKLPFYMDYMFLPAPATWIEYRVPDSRRKELDDSDGSDIEPYDLKSMRCTILRKGALIEFHDEAFYILTCDEVDGMAIHHDGTQYELNRVPLIADTGPCVIPLAVVMGDKQPDPAQAETLAMLQILNVVNQPHLVDVVEQQPHRGLVRALSKQKIQFSSRGSNIITLKKGVTPSNLEVVAKAARVGGKKIYHFTRSYFKPSLGKTIPSYWSGSKEKGIKPMPDYVVKV